MRRRLRAVLRYLRFELRVLLAQPPRDVGVDVFEHGAQRGLRGLALSADGSRLALVDANANVVVWNLNEQTAALKFVARKRH